MFFSKSFGYAVRGVLYIALMQDEDRHIKVEEIASRLNAPKHFMAKILKNLVKEKVLSSVKGPAGGFSLNRNTLELPLIKIVSITDGDDFFDKCILSAKECNNETSCPVHYNIFDIRNKLHLVLLTTTIAELMSGDKKDLVKRLSAAVNVNAVLIHKSGDVY